MSELTGHQSSIRQRFTRRGGSTIPGSVDYGTDGSDGGGGGGLNLPTNINLVFPVLNADPSAQLVVTHLHGEFFGADYHLFLATETSASWTLRIQQIFSTDGQTSQLGDYEDYPIPAGTQKREYTGIGNNVYWAVYLGSPPPVYEGATGLQYLPFNMEADGTINGVYVRDTSGARMLAAAATTTETSSVAGLLTAPTSSSRDTLGDLAAHQSTYRQQLVRVGGSLNLGAGTPIETSSTSSSKAEDQ